MELSEIRKEINDVDRQIEELFIKRMRLCFDVAEYKIKNDLPVFQSGREQEILERVRSDMPDELKSSAEVLFTSIMDISKCKQYQKFFADKNKIESETLELSGNHTVAVPGTNGSYSHISCGRFFEKYSPLFYESFEDVFKAVENGAAEFGVLPIANSTAGSVGQTYELLKEYDLKICASAKVRINHCLAVKKGTDINEVKTVYSHEQGLFQCSGFIRSMGFKTSAYSNTALAAAFIKSSEEPYGAICSEQCAEEMGLEIIRRDIADACENYTKFILVSKKTLVAANANIISVSLALPHISSALYRLLTKFSVAGLNLLMIESRPIANTDFDAVFYLDFEGSVNSPDVAKLLNELESELSYFKFLGNYIAID
ncbi:bifunctional chorismate mutase/prephenate dehydratase [Ruminococcus sp. Marseille-P6503]|uniref:bifunctional chorismate mutase/prephenate dehydratase n=1 Tax=Ruminococcus sp. Marseille-P6503 TaxID=2364796 RepID=UPI000F545B3D|nr:bifunctional chorismate mutase/prephenate dehydratase [Ruminococcus sp. Marseille-P6503]